MAATSDLAGICTPGNPTVEADSKNKKRLGVYNTNQGQGRTRVIAGAFRDGWVAGEKPGVSKRLHVMGLRWGVRGLRLGHACEGVVGTRELILIQGEMFH